MKISSVGTGYVGLVLGVCLAEKGHQVVCVDIDRERIDKINSGISPIYEKGIDAILKRNVDEGNLRGTTDLDEAVANTSVSFICVGTPSGLGAQGDIDTKYVEEAAVKIGQIIREKDEYHLVVLKSTVIPGTTEHLVVPLLEEHSNKKAGEDFGVVMNPEFLREGQAIEDFMHPDRIVLGGIDDRSNEVLRELYRVFDSQFLETSPKVAEMIKYATNSYLATKISFINDVGNICKLLGIDTYKVAEGLGMDRRVSPNFLESGIGFGGSCFPKDLKALVAKAQEVYYRPGVLNAALELNETQPLRLVDLVEKRVGELKGVDVVVLGLAFKPGTDDIRDAPSIKIINALLERGARVHMTDPRALDKGKEIFGKGENICYYISAKVAVTKGNHIIIATDWDEYKHEGLYKGKEVFDGRRVEEARVADYYEGVCW